MVCDEIHLVVVEFIGPDLDARFVMLCRSKLMVILKDYVDKSNEYTGHEMLLRAVKSLEYIFKFIIRSRVLFSM